MIKVELSLRELLDQVNFEILKTQKKDFWKSHKMIPLKNNWLVVDDVEKNRALLHYLFNDKFAKLNSCESNQFNQLFEKVFSEEKTKSVDWLSELNSNRAQIENSEEEDESGAVIRLAKNLIDQAVLEEATDLHFEPEENQLKVRVRKDGLLKPIQELPKWVMASLTSRLKIMGNLDISEKRLPQDGRIQWRDKKGDLDIRLSTLPTRFGEKLVLRILRTNVKLDALDDLKIPEPLHSKIKNCFSQPQGILYVTGPTGSGKSSTLYAGLRTLSHPGINITTIEDPIEYHLDGANQVQINEKSGLSFAKALRSILRQDPDVILIGETRDLETAQISIQAAQTGHLVLSTLHTNDSLSAVNRLRDIGIAPYLIASSLLGVIAQRLVRKVCEHCVERVDIEAHQLAQFPELASEEEAFKVPKEVGCEKCGNTGFNGRIALFEFLEINAELKEKIHREDDLNPIKEFKDDAKVWWSLREDGINKIKLGLSTPSELVRVLGV